MNKEVIYTDKKALIIYDEGNQKESESYDNLNEILSQENVIEILTTEMNDIKNELVKLEAQTQPTTLKSKLKFWIFFISFACGTIVSALNGHEFLFSVFTIAASYTVIGASGIKLSKKSDINKKNGLDCQLKYLKNQLVKEKGKLAKLNHEKKVVKTEDDLRIFQINEDEKLAQISENYRSCYRVGFDLRKHYKNLLDNTLDEEIELSDDEYKEFIKDYIETKGPVLTRKK